LRQFRGSHFFWQVIEFHVNDCASHQGSLDLLLVSRISLDWRSFWIVTISITNVAKSWWKFLHLRLKCSMLKKISWICLTCQCVHKLLTKNTINWDIITKRIWSLRFMNLLRTKNMHNTAFFLLFALQLTARLVFFYFS
jgi:hypothetical protein